MQAYEPIGRSALSRQLAELPAALRSTLKLTDAAIRAVNDAHDVLTRCHVMPTM